MTRPRKPLGQILFEAAPVGYLTKHWRPWHELPLSHQWVHEYVAQAVARAVRRRGRKR
jgi:hypothetical protein